MITGLFCNFTLCRSLLDIYTITQCSTDIIACIRLLFWDKILLSPASDRSVSTATCKCQS
ncbi:unnamed protein product [Ixodes persulcatus]